jgi:hypothetical protein
MKRSVDVDEDIPTAAPLHIHTTTHITKQVALSSAPNIMDIILIGL